jgi:hypothetical protein
MLAAGVALSSTSLSAGLKLRSKGLPLLPMARTGEKGAVLLCCVL